MQLSLTAASAAANLTRFASDVTGATWTLTATTTSDGLAHTVTVRNDTANNHSGKTITLVGTDADGLAVTETMAGPAGSATVTSTLYYATLTSVTVDATIGADTFDIGQGVASVTAFSLRPQVTKISNFVIGFGCTVSAGSPNYTLEHTYDGSAIFTHSSISGETTSQEGTYTTPVRAMRLKFSAAGTVVFTGFQATPDA